ncbi:hypothetical protein NT6N_40360 [Oceaniferula spumae]|uniref:OmpH family outer membrane protein n=1 Tax=Oceaniferula spumae TaxID=2979115 RepID=A0AAT9FSH7_9BACT
MKLAALSCLAMLLLGASVSRLQAAELKIATVDVREIFDKWKYATESKEKLEKAREALERENNERLAVINEYQMMRSKMHQKYHADKDSVSAEEKAKLDRQFVSLGRDAFALEENRRDFFSKAKRAHDREVSSQSKLILDRITEAVQVYALEKKYDMVIEMGGYTTRNVPLFVHLDSAQDITAVIIKRLNESGN